MSSVHRSSPFFLSLVPCFFMLFSLSSSASTLTSHSQCLDLLDLKKGFFFSSTSSTTSLPSWLAGTDCCHWEGVSCDETSGLIVSLDLSERYINGSLMPSLFNLASLQILNLAFNYFRPNPHLQWRFENLPSLTHLNLSTSGVTDQIPMGISRLKKLVSLDLSWWKWKGDHPPLELRKLIGDLSNLKELYLDGINISANGIEWCGAISDSAPMLQTLSLAFCSLSGSIDRSLSKLRNLSILRLDGNHLFSEVPEFFRNFSSLSVLRLFDCKLHGLFPKQVFQLKNLKVLDLSNNPMLSGCLPEFPKESTLESLILEDTNFSGSLPESIGNLKFLTDLDLINCYFSGVIPSSIENVSELVHLALSENAFTGEIPEVVGGARISTIYLSYNNLTGPIPASFGKLQPLIILDLQSNSLTGSIPLSLFTLPGLQEMNLKNNSLSDQLEEFSNASSSLSKVDLRFNNLQGEIPRSMFNLSGLQILGLGSNNFNGTVEFKMFGRLRYLVSLDLSGIDLLMLDGTTNSSLLFPSLIELLLVSCNLTTIPAFLKHSNDVRVLDLSNNRIGGTIPNWIWSMRNSGLFFLDLSCNLFTSLEESFSNLSVNIHTIDLHSNLLQGPIPFPPPNSFIVDYSNNLFTSSIPVNISYYLNNTLFFSLSNNSLTGEVPSSICSATNLYIFDLSHNNLNGSIPACLFESLTDLRVLNAQGNGFQGIMPQKIGSRCALQTINLHGNKLEGVVPSSLANCVELEVLDLGRNKLADAFPYWLVNLPALKVLVLKENKFYGHLTGSCEGNHILTMLQIFDISSNRFTGSLPSDCFRSMKAMMVDQGGTETIGYWNVSLPYYQDTVTVNSKGLEMELVKILTTFTSIDMSNNRFVGDVPKVIGNLKSLRVLNVSLNALAGEIPQELGNMVVLESLDLSGNQFLGVIPSSLTSLYSLEFLNLSNNNLVGRIPQGNQFNTFSNSSFDGNPGLCGSPLSRDCISPTTLEPSSDSKNPPTEFDMEVIWLWLFRGLGYGVGFASIICYQLFFPKWKMWYKRRFINR